MKLTEDDISIEQHMNGYYLRFGGKGENSLERCEELKGEILKNQVKAEKWDKLEEGIALMEIKEHKITFGQYFAKIINENQQLHDEISGLNYKTDNMELAVEIVEKFKKGYESSIDAVTLAEKYTEIYEEYLSDEREKEDDN